MGETYYKGRTYYEPEKQSQQALAEADIYTFRYYPQNHLLVVTDAAVENTGCKKFYESMPYSLMEDMIIPEDYLLCEEMYARIDSGEKHVTANLRCKRTIEVMRVTITTTDWDEQGRPESAIGIIERPEEGLRTAELVRALSDDYHSIYFIDFDKDQLIPYRMSAETEKLYGAYLRTYPTPLESMKRFVEQSVMPDDREEMMKLCDSEYFHNQFRDSRVLIRDFRVAGAGKTAYCRMKIVNLSDGDSLHQIIVGISDISREKIKELERFAYIDPVTGGDNYVRFKEKLSEKTEKGYIVSLDIHSFKVVNSICGTVKGDEILREIWKCIQKNLRENDLAAHINADHYIIYFETEDVSLVTERLEMLTIQLSKRSAELSVPQQIPYFGVSVWEPQKTIEQIYNEANIAQQEIKDRKDINHAFFSQEDASRIQREKQMEDAFETSINEHRFEVWYQPKYSPDSAMLVGAEALVRWRNAEGELVPPGVFIPLFERNGMIRYLDEYVFRTVCLQQKAWMDEGRQMIPISVNLSRASLYFQSVVERYLMITKDIGIDPVWVPIEITETAALDDKAVRQLANRFYEAGFPLHIDDFGAGYSSFATLNIMHFDTLKIDKSLIDYIGNYGGDRLLEHTIALAKELGMHVTAEGVENETQVAFLQKLHCDSIQGYYYSRPLPLDEFAKKIYA